MQRHGKYNAHKTECCCGHMHDSKAEAERCDTLYFLQKKGVISNLRTQVKYILLSGKKYENMPNERAITYIADFVYMHQGVTRIEDFKGKKTPEYVIKRKLLKAQYCADGKTIFIETHK